jgi:glutaminyl-peptide cyclotransferase
LSTKSPDPSGPEETAGIEILQLVEHQVARGPRTPGSIAHDELASFLERSLREHSADVTAQEFTVSFRGSTLHCVNLVGVFRSKEASPSGAPILLGTHYDTRVQADRDPDPVQQIRPIAGANDGGSGTAVLLHMLRWLAETAFPRDLAVAFFDAEDLGNIDGKEFSLGAAWCASHPVSGFSPREVVVLDMVGGKDMVLDIDAHILHHAGSRRLTSEVFRAGSLRGWPPFCRDKPQRLKYIISDHQPFLLRGIDSCILIDIDYPQWHTQADVPSALSAESLGITEAALSLFLSPRRG